MLAPGEQRQPAAGVRDHHRPHRPDALQRVGRAGLVRAAGRRRASGAGWPTGASTWCTSTSRPRPSVSVLALWAARVPGRRDVPHRPGAVAGRSRPPRRPFLRAGLAKIDAHVAVSDEAHRTMARYLDAEPTLIPNGVHVAPVRRSARDVRAGGPTPGRSSGGWTSRARGCDVLLRGVAGDPRATARRRGSSVVGGGLGARPGPRTARRRRRPHRLRRRARRRRQGRGARRRPTCWSPPTPTARASGSCCSRRWRPVPRSRPATSRRSASVLGDGRYGALFRAGDAGDLAAVGRRAARRRRPAPPGRRTSARAVARRRTTGASWRPGCSTSTTACASADVGDRRRTPPRADRRTPGWARRRRLVPSDDPHRSALQAPGHEHEEEPSD